MRAVALPDDPGAFVSAAERATNDRDLNATVGVYAPTARLESLTDGAWERYEGIEEIKTAWQGYLDAFVRAQRRLESRHFRQRIDLMMYEKNRQEVLKDLGADPYVD